MRIPCPHCGPRGHEEFAYYGDATPRRPDPSDPEAERSFCDYVYLRDNPAGLHRELWYHAQGCQSWLIVERDTRTHEIGGVVSARSADPAEQTTR
jgi:heterotetrameric sarcosine oxidase delta subunit